MTRTPRRAAVALLGGLGNQLFQAAFASRLEIEFGTPFHLDTCGSRRADLRALLPAAPFVDTCKGVPALAPLGRLHVLGHGLRVMAGYGRHHVDVSLYGPDGLEQLSPYRYWAGYWQNPRNVDVAHDLVTSVRKSLRGFTQWLDDARTAHPNAEIVAVHVRRGDYQVSTPLLSRGYYATAQRRALERSGARQTLTVVTTDDIAWAQTIDFGGEVIVADGTNALTDLATLTFADRRVISHSTFSWWAARLAHRAGAATTFAPRPWSLGTAIKDDGGKLRLPAWNAVHADYQ